MIHLILISFLKFVLQKLFSKMKMKIDKIHILSSLIPLLIYLLLAFIFKIDFEYFLLVTIIFLMGSYILVNIPGAYVTSIRIRIFEILHENGSLKKNDFYLKFNDEILFNDRFERINKYNIIEEKNNKFYLISKKISFLIFFVNIMRIIFKKMNKY